MSATRTAGELADSLAAWGGQLNQSPRRRGACLKPSAGRRQRMLSTTTTCTWPASTAHASVVCVSATLAAGSAEATWREPELWLVWAQFLRRVLT